MKRAGNLWPRVVDRQNMVRAFHQSAKGKRRKTEVRRFASDLDRRVDAMRAALLDGSFEVGGFHVFKVFDPKERTIHAARFSERVFHHALMNVCEPVLERQAVHHSYACRVGKGRLMAIAAASKHARRNDWYLKLDIRKYFESIPHDPLVSRLHRLFKDPTILAWLERIIRSHHGETGRGLPIGSLTSQHLANLYLAPVDRYCQSSGSVAGYVRYMDDFVCWGPTKQGLLWLGREVDRMILSELDLALKHPPSPQRSALGMDFLGYRIYPTHTRLSRRSKVRYRRKLKGLVGDFEAGQLSEGAFQQRATALTAFLLPAASHRYRKRTLAFFGSLAIGHEPGESGRLLEQQRAELPFREPQQQQPDQQQQQPGLPPCPQLRPGHPDGVIRTTQGTEPATDPIPHTRDETPQHSARAGRSVDTGSNARAEPFS